MRAWAYNKFGDASVVKLSDVQEPKIVDPHDIVVKVHAAALNPVDYKRRHGDLKLLLDETWPAVVGYDVSGVVVHCGSSVAKFRVGDAVFATLPNTRTGSLAERVSANESFFAKKPFNLTHVEAASLAMTSLTALLAFRRANLTTGKKVLITGGAGGVGTAAIQIAKHVFHAAEIATTASAKKVDKLKALGATQVIDYNKDKFETKLSSYDMAFDLTAESIRCFDVIRPKGSVISVAEVPSPDLLYNRENEGIKISWFVGFVLKMLSRSVTSKARKADINYEFFYLASNGDALDEIRVLCEEEKLVPVLDKVYAFDKAVAAMPLSCRRRDSASSFSDVAFASTPRSPINARASRSSASSPTSGTGILKSVRLWAVRVCGVDYPLHRQRAAMTCEGVIISNKVLSATLIAKWLQTALDSTAELCTTRWRSSSSMSHNARCYANTSVAMNGYQESSFYCSIEVAACGRPPWFVYEISTIRSMAVFSSWNVPLNRRQWLTHSVRGCLISD